MFETFEINQNYKINKKLTFILGVLSLLGSKLLLNIFLISTLAPRLRVVNFV